MKGCKAGYKEDHGYCVMKRCSCLGGCCEHYGDISKADRIRAMSDEELAKHFSGLICDINEGVEYHETPSRWLEWLKQPAED